MWSFNIILCNMKGLMRSLMICSPNVVRVIKSSRMRWAGHVAHMGGGGEACTGFWWGNVRERDHWGDPGVDGRIILRGILRKWEGIVELDGAGSGKGQVAVTCE
jgi:hypothetical protein